MKSFNTVVKAIKLADKMPQFDFDAIDTDGTGNVSYAEWEAYCLNMIEGKSF